MSGEPVVDRKGKPIAREEMTRVMLPACDGPVGCNGKLEQRFETAKSTLRRLFQACGETVIAAGDVEGVALWFLKTWLLLAHPKARYSDPVIERLGLESDSGGITQWRSGPAPQEYYSWTVDGSRPPAGVSVWLYRVPDHDDRSDVAPGRVVPLPIVTADGRVVRFQVLRVTLHGMNVTLVYHPGWGIEHPLEVDGRAVRLWPLSVTGDLDLSKLPPLNRQEGFAWIGGDVALRDGVIGTKDLPPLCAGELLGWTSAHFQYIRGGSAPPALRVKAKP